MGVVAQNKEPAPFFNYLLGLKTLAKAKSTAANAQEFLDTEHLERALAVRALTVAKKVFGRWQTVKASTLEKTNDLLALETNVMAKYHC